MKLLVLMPAEAVSGPGRQLAALAARLHSRGVDVRIIVLQRQAPSATSYAAFLERAGVPHEIVPDRGPLDYGILRRVRASIEQWQPDIIQTHGYKASAVAFMLRKMGSAQPWVGCYHGWTREDLKARAYHVLDHWLLGHADRIIVMSGSQAEEFAAYKSKVRVIHNAIIPLAENADQEEIRRLAALFQQMKRPVLGVIGRLSQEKGVDVFLSACHELRAQGRSFGAAIVGDGPQRAELESLRSRLGLEEIVHFTGSVQSMHAVYRAIDLLVIPSRSEGLPNVLLEALAAELPVVSTAVGAIPDVLEHGQAGLLVRPEAPRELAGAIAQVFDGTLDREDAIAARRDAAERLSLDRRVAEHMNVYENVLHEEPARMRPMSALRT
jgi:glycosyltransferase involved in cell wall biosynthesis